MYMSGATSRSWCLPPFENPGSATLTNHFQDLMILSFTNRNNLWQKLPYDLIPCWKKINFTSGGSMISRGCYSKRWESRPIILAIVPKTARNWKKNEPRGGRESRASPLRSANRVTHCCFHLPEHLSGWSWSPMFVPRRNKQNTIVVCNHINFPLWNHTPLKMLKI